MQQEVLAPEHADPFDRFLHCVQRHPSGIALIEASTSRETTYGELSQSVEMLRSVVVRNGWRRRIVLIALERSAALVAAELGVWAAGAVPVVIGSEQPDARVDALAEESACAGMICAENGRVPAGMTRIIVPSDLGSWASDVIRTVRDEGLAPAARRPGEAGNPVDEPCYGVFTSGSSGTPKLVLVGSGALSNLTDWFVTEYGLRYGIVATVMVNPAFDVHVMEVWTALTSGATALIIDEGDVRLDSRALVDTLVRHSVAVVFVPTPLARGFVTELAQRTSPTKLRHVLIGGDRLDFWPPPVADVSFHNQYGPAECAVVSTALALSAFGGELSGPPPIGHMIPGATCLVVDETGSPVGSGVVGELWIAGAGLALGYARRPDLTNERFVQRHGRRYYRTGDLVRLDPVDVLDFVGRLDDQVKVRGFRVEPGEVEAATRHCPGVREVAVVADASTGATRLVAFVAGDVEGGYVRRFLAGVLPDYMVPSVVVAVVGLPLTANEKVDRAALRSEAALMVSGQDTNPMHGVRLVGEAETALAEIWRAVLGIEEVGPEDDFFDLGGHSLAAMRVVAKAQEQGWQVSLRDMLSGGNLRSIATSL